MIWIFYLIIINMSYNIYKTYEDTFWNKDKEELRKELKDLWIVKFIKNHNVSYNTVKKFLSDDHYLLSEKVQEKTKRYNEELKKDYEKVKKKYWISEMHVKKLLMKYTFSEILKWELIDWKIVIKDIVKMY